MYIIFVCRWWLQFVVLYTYVVYNVRVKLWVVFFWFTLIMWLINYNKWKLNGGLFNEVFLGWISY